MSANQADFPIAVMARVLGVSKAGYTPGPAGSRRRAMVNAALLKRIRTVHLGSHETYGAPRIHAELREQGVRHSALGYRSPVVYEQEAGSEPAIETLLSQVP